MGEMPGEKSPGIGEEEGAAVFERIAPQQELDQQNEHNQNGRARVRNHSRGWRFEVHQGG